MTRAADLHLHTRHSDGTFTPAEVVRRAGEAGLSCIALTDHDTVAGLPTMTELCQAAGIEFIPGIELTAHVGEREVHVLGYLVCYTEPEFVTQIEHFKEARAQRVAEMVTKLQTAGVDLQASDVTSVADRDSALGRLHVARALMNRGFVRHMDEAFHRFIGKGKPAFVPKTRLDVAAAAALIHKFCGVAILAHPGISGLENQLDGLLAAGLDGLEVWHSRHTAAQCERFLAFAQARSCLVTGGSDCHGLAKDEVLIGSVRLDYSHVERLKEFHAWTLSKGS
ncbi:MAG: PHP domain-containing protein [Verrucomicrobia bacterium]|nr:PHP domain-containing protein [Verrucomicrobiota bacterium]